MRTGSQRWMGEHPKTLRLVLRCWDRQGESSQADKAALAAWVTHMVMTSPVRVTGAWAAWPPVFRTSEPHKIGGHSGYHPQDD